MPIDGTILGLQRRDAPLGEIRIGTSVEVPGKKGRQPKRLDTFRFTTSVELNAHAVAAKYGGQVAPWSQRKGRWEVITDRAALDVWVPPAGAAVDTNMEMWDGPRRLRQCNGRVEGISGEPCSCPRPADPYDPVSVRRALDERHRLASLRPPRACKPLTRINVTIPDLPGLVGTWKLNTGSENAAVETAGAGDAMTLAREGGVYLPAVLSIQWRNRADTGAPYPVPFLQIGLSMREIAGGQLPAGPGGLLAQLRSTGEQKALTAGQAEAGQPVPPPDLSMVDDREPMSAQQIADMAATASSREKVQELIARAEADGVDAELVQTAAPGQPEYYTELRKWLRAVWKFGPDKAREAVRSE